MPNSLDLNVSPAQLHTFANHPFHVRKDMEMNELVDSIRESGVIVPLIVRSRVYIIFTTEEIMEALSCANQKACRLMLELEKDAGLIERKRQGLGKPSLIYVKNFAVSS